MSHSRRTFIKRAVAASAYATTPTVLHSAQPKHSSKLTDSVKLSIGTGGSGHTTPAATVPFGAVQLGPDTGDYGWEHCSGYHYDDTRILGFSHTHLSGTGVGDMLDFRLSPGYSASDPRQVTPEYFEHAFSHNHETSEPGYYCVDLSNVGIVAELTATERAGYHRYTFSKQAGCILLNLEPVWRIEQRRPDETTLVLWSYLKVGNGQIIASRSTNAWAKGRIIHAYLDFSIPFSKVDFYEDGRLVDAPSSRSMAGRRLMCVLHFDNKPLEAIEIKVGISGVDVDGAKRNVNAEMPHWDFFAIRRQALASWEAQLSRVRVVSGNDRQKQIFYTGLYHSMLAPTLFDDVDCRYMGMDGLIHQSKAGCHNYSTYSLWDTYRALHPMLTLIMPERVPDFVSCLVRQATESPEGVPVWPLQGKETGCMDGYHSAAVVAEALVKGFPGIDAKTAYRVYHQRAELDPYRGLDSYRRYGYVPCDLQDESASKTCDYSYDDWCVAAIAEAAGELQEAEKLRIRSKSYQNLYDRQSGFIRPRYSDGHWASPFNPKSITVTKWRDYTEANAWETTFLAQHDGPGLAAMLGGNPALEKKLDELFNQSPDLPPDVPPDMTGMVGQYCQGNEPCHHITYYYNVAGAPHKTQKRINFLLNSLYGSEPNDGMSGNDDCGQMSAWFCMNALGFYAVDPVSGQYDIGMPLFDKVIIRVNDTKSLLIEAHRQSSKSIYVKSVRLNGSIQSGWKLGHRELSQGGHLLFEMVDSII